jgi:peptidoglycan/xylan/chitin deacetylase (PgdA/CDA1 family)
MGVAFKSKKILSWVTDTVGLPDFALSRLKSRIIFGYHRILPEAEANAKMSQDCMWVSPSSFEKQIQWMQRIGRVVSVESMVKDRAIPAAEPNFAITFDDGWIDNYEHAFPLLKKYNLPAMIFLSTNAIETNEMFWPDEIFYKTDRSVRSRQAKKIVEYITSLDGIRTSRKRSNIDELLNDFVEWLKLLDAADRKKTILDYYEYIRVDPAPIPGQILKWDHIREMQKHNITFGSHTHSHMITEGAAREEILAELKKSKEIIESRLNTNCRWFCYPNARFNEYDHELLRKAGYDYGVTLHCARLTRDDSPYYLPRFIMYEDITKVLGYIKLRLLRVPFF